MEAFFNHLNPAIIRKVLGKADQKEFIDCALFIKQKALNLCPGTKRDMYVSLFVWCRKHYQKKYGAIDLLFDDF